MSGARTLGGPKVGQRGGATRDADGGTTREAVWRGAGTLPLEMEVFTSLEAVEDEWRRLAGQRTNLFATWEWAEAWWRHFGRERPLRIVGCRRADGRIAGLLPFYVWRRFPRTLRFIGHGPADRLGAVCAPADRPAVADALARVLRGEGPRGWDVAVLDAVAGDEVSAIPTGSIEHRTPWPIIAMAGMSWDDFLGQHRRLREQLTKGQRRLEALHQVRYRLSDDPARLPDDLETLIRLHDARWGRGGAGTFSGPRRRFHEEFSAVAMARGWLRLWFLEVDGTAVAAKHNFRFGGAEWGYQAGRDPAWDRHGVGTLLFGHVLRDGFEAGATEYRMLRGDEAYKQRFATDDPGCRLVVAPGSYRGRAATAAAGVVARSGRARRAVGSARRLPGCASR